ncbi:fibronectin type III-like domain-contianing protein [Streptomyces beigongshangae]|uniref:fibronectin type III-like domain-contianing protein n=1 Tax=Streptomyces beigongshangae TaxID=2841597 RepID=UPI0021A90845|nr:fibronectin type III-like domain-contianing protein [Streptomyces sp. REN17]
MGRRAVRLLPAGGVDGTAATVTRRTLSFRDEAKGRWVTPAGKVPVYVGRSSADTEYAGSVSVR